MHRSSCAWERIANRYELTIESFHEEICNDAVIRRFVDRLNFLVESRSDRNDIVEVERALTTLMFRRLPLADRPKLWAARRLRTSIRFIAK